MNYNETDIPFTYRFHIEKSISENGKVYVQGIATGTAVDGDEQKMGKGVIDTFYKRIMEGIKNGNPLKLTNGHPKGGPVGGDLGEIVGATLLNDANNSLTIKSELDIENPFSKLLVRDLEKGKKYGFSIEGYAPTGAIHKVYDETVGKWVGEIKDLIPKSISVTTDPSYVGSLVDVVYKSTSKVLQDNGEGSTINLVNSKIDNMDEIKTETTVEKAEVNTETLVTKEVATEMPIAEEVKAEELIEAIEEIVEEVKEELEKVEEAKEEEAEVIESARIDYLCSLVEQMNVTLAGLVQSDLDVHESMKSITSKMELLEKSVSTKTEELLTVEKSLHDEVEVLKTLPKAKKTIASQPLVEKNFSDRKVEVLPANFHDAYLQLVGE